MSTENAVIVYSFVDPGFKGDLRSTLEQLSSRGVRVVQGDNADELLFLLQVGRPAAIIYTLASNQSRSAAAFQTVSRRALDMLVPLIVVGPEDPRDGVVLLYPDGGNVMESHVPLHSIIEMVDRFDKTPPSTLSRPPEAVAQQTVGKGRTLLSWNPAEVKATPGASDAPGPRVSSAPGRAVNKDTILSANSGGPARETMPAKKRTSIEPGFDTSATQMGMPAVPPRPETRSQVATKMGMASQPPQVEVSSQVSTQMGMPDVPARPHVAGARSRGAEKTEPVDLANQADAPAIERVQTTRTAPLPSSIPPGPPAGGGQSVPIWKILVGGAVAVVIAAVVVAGYLIMHPSGQGGEVSPVVAPISAGVDSPRPPAVVTKPGEPQEAPVPETAADSAPASAVVPSEEKVASDTPSELSGSKQRDKFRPSTKPSATTGDSFRGIQFAGHFRENTATFWFAGSWEETRVIQLVKNVGPGKKIRLVGHPTILEVGEGKAALGLSRAWAVEKYLIRQGVDPEVITTAKGEAVSKKSDTDDNGWARNRWVDLIVE